MDEYERALLSIVDPIVKKNYELCVKKTMSIIALSFADN